MAKQTAAESPKSSSSSPFDALRIARRGSEKDSQTVGQPDSQTVPRSGRPGAASSQESLAKSGNPDYMKFTTYVKKKTHLAVKSRLVAQERELSDLVEELLENWLRNSPPVQF